MWSYYDLVVAQDRADRIRSAGYRLPVEASVEFSAEDAARHLRAARGHTGGRIRSLLRRFGLLAGPTATPSFEPAAAAQVTPIPARRSRPVPADTAEARKAA